MTYYSSYEENSEYRVQVQYDTSMLQAKSCTGVLQYQYCGDTGQGERYPVRQSDSSDYSIIRHVRRLRWHKRPRSPTETTCLKFKLHKIIIFSQEKSFFASIIAFNTWW